MASEFLEDLESDKTVDESEVATETGDENATPATVEATESEASATPAPTGDEGPPEGSTPEQQAQWSAVKDEREKRRLAREERDRALAEAAHWRAQAERQQAPQEQYEPPSKEEVESEFLKDPIGFMEERDRYRDAAYQAQLIDQRVVMSANYMRQTVSDFQEKANAFIELASGNKQLEDMARNSPDPARFAYDFMVRQEQGSIDVDSIKRQAKEEALAEFKRQQAANDVAQGPTSPAGSGGAGGASSVQRVETLDGFLDKQPF